MSDTPRTDEAYGTDGDGPDRIDRMLDLCWELERENARVRDALNHCLLKLKHHHLSRPGIREVIKKTQEIIPTHS